MSENKENALNTFVGIIGECRTECAKISQLIDDHLGSSPDDINWVDVGDAGRLRDLLKEITEIFVKQNPETK